MSAPVLELKGLQVSYAGNRALDLAGLAVAPGEVVGVVGANGAGKSTLVNAVAGWSRGAPRVAGPITLDGERVDAWPTHQRVRAGLVLVPEGRVAFGRMAVEDNLSAAFAAPPAPGRRVYSRDEIYELFPRLEERKLNRGRQLSGGEQEMLSIARALLVNPRLLILDEPSQGLAPLVVREVFRIVQQMKAEGISILLVEQNARMGLEIADDAYVLDDGMIVYSGGAQELAADEARVRALAGASAEQWTFA